MAAPDYPLTKDMLSAMLMATRIENEKMADALHDVLVLCKKPSPTAEFYGIKRQQLETRVAHLLVLKSAFDKYAELVCIQQKASKRKVAGTRSAEVNAI